MLESHVSYHKALQPLWVARTLQFSRLPLRYHQPLVVPATKNKATIRHWIIKLLPLGLVQTVPVPSVTAEVVGDHQLRTFGDIVSAQLFCTCNACHSFILPGQFLYNTVSLTH